LPGVKHTSLLYNFIYEFQWLYNIGLCRNKLVRLALRHTFCQVYYLQGAL
jgi:hypothetical protein